MNAFVGLLRRLSYVLAALGVFLPSVVLVVLLLEAFWYIGQGRDVVTLTLELPRRAVFALSATVFAAYVCWYSARLVGFSRLPVLRRSRAIQVYAPRVLGFSCFTVTALAFLRAHCGLGGGVLWVLLLVWIGWFLLLERFSRWITKRTAKGLIDSRWRIDPTRRKSVAFAFTCTCIVIVLGVGLAYVAGAPWGPVIGLFLAQAAYTVQVCCRQAWATVLSPPGWMVRAASSLALLKRVSASEADAQTPGRPPFFAPNELYYFLFFNVFAVIVLGLFIAANYSVRWSATLGPMAIALTGLAVLLGSINLLRLIARQLHVNLFFCALVATVVLGLCWDPHTVRTIQLGVAHPQRPVITDRFAAWMEARRAEVQALPADSSYPVFLVMSDGGASRSGYWVTNVLGRLQAETGGRFSRHLFSLSGASGGSVGNATFLALLAQGSDPAHITGDARTILRQDMLSPALANMLGADMLHFLVPVLQGRDRAAALEQAFGEAGALVDKDLFEQPFDRFINDSLPVFMINTTRMQDARAAVVSNVQLTPGLFNERLDVLGRMADSTSLRLSTAVMLGARFPYVSPAGQLEGRMPNGRLSHDQFVDGGYFDNSGAGVTQEMIIALLDRFATDTLFARMDLHVLHITNGIKADTIAQRAKLPLLNDLAAPIITIAGAYGAQTDINDLRLRRFMQRHYGDDAHFHTIDLYEALPGKELSMNWAISEAQLQLMDSSATACKELGRVLQLVH